MEAWREGCGKNRQRGGKKKAVMVDFRVKRRRGKVKREIRDVVLHVNANMKLDAIKRVNY